jgi:hypothetical protein
MAAKEFPMPQFPPDTGLSSNRVVGWLISHGFEITIVENAPRYADSNADRESRLS